jgi:hypothetical protein
MSSARPTIAASNVEAERPDMDEIVPVGRDNQASDEHDVEKPIVPDATAQAGVKKIEAITLSWSKASLATLLCL